MSTDLSALWDFGDPVASEQRLRAAAEAAGAAAREPDRLVALTQVARALGLQARYADAHGMLDRVLADLSRQDLADDAASAVSARVELERGRLLRSAEEHGAAERFTEATTLARQAGDVPLEVDALHMRALAELDPGSAVRLNREALRVARASADPAARRWEASLLNNLGCALVDAGRPDEALAVFEEAVEQRVRRGERRETQVGRWMVAWTLRLLGRSEEALAAQRVLKAELVADGVEDPYVDEEIALLEGDPTT
jgi:tetratricopeptide (TPR) repeat protein